MASNPGKTRSVLSLELPDPLFYKLIESNIRSIFELEQTVDSPQASSVFNSADIQTLKDALKFENGFQSLQKAITELKAATRWILTGIEEFDSLFNKRGLSPTCILELSGPSNTILCVALALFFKSEHSQNKTVLYIDTDGSFTLDGIKNAYNIVKNKHNCSTQKDASAEQQDSSADWSAVESRVRVARVFNQYELIGLLSQLRINTPTLHFGEIGAIIIDNPNSVMRHEINSVENDNTKPIVFEVANQVNALSVQLKVPVILVNSLRATFQQTGLPNLHRNLNPNLETPPSLRIIESKIQQYNNLSPAEIVKRNTREVYGADTIVDSNIKYTSLNQKIWDHVVTERIVITKFYQNVENISLNHQNRFAQNTNIGISLIMSTQYEKKSIELSF
ncbi:hypothetical protein BB561_002195 [Smittium simulii]|uniref:Uncharacterized protein n=1 Tax=Smittium simulii TaxID=133385 RepID=A0A2T9YRL6_9FUNG|nr:hypothetical protein BB561_002195 [Smittium simulii]